MDLIVWIIGIAFVLWVWSVMRRGAARERDRRAQELVEQIGLDLLSQHPSADDALIVQLIRDELLNRRARDPFLFKWASAETVGRMRRTAARLASGRLASQQGDKP